MPTPLDLVPHRRYNPLLRQWILVSPQRTARPWQGETTKPAPVPSLAYDPACYLCPTNPRSNGQHNPAYTAVFAFNNDFPALLPDEQAASATTSSPLLRAEPERGLCRVLCFHPNHSLTLARMSVPDIALVVDAWAAETAALADIPWINHIQIFENRGAMMGASNPHPHCQIWATEHIPDEPLRELASQQAYHDEHHRCLLCDYLAAETSAAADQNRIVAENDLFLALVPYWATWPFETLVLPRRHLGAFTDLTALERHALADILSAVTIRYDNLFEVPFPYTMGFHQRPTHISDANLSHEAMHFHAHFYPPLLRSAEIRKFMVGFEMLGMPQRDLTPETAAARLRALPTTHYTER
ncbi:MAG TPA: UDP-glucose--hexose-1-phosphate uridylyltransferase [Acidobacteriaceae bacterium]|nr:UDP-glucose--hexose-1-phosphate uridylyltransferase [Acidobacteriaceae bacterium]